MGKKKTPLILKLRSLGGTLFVFPSSAEDIGLNLQSTTTGVAMSHYALLNIPELTINNCLCGSETTALNGNEALAMSLQNYAMNFETYLTNRSDYNYQELGTVSEKVFWHWAKKVGIISTSKFTNEKTSDPSIYVESGKDTDRQTLDDTVVKCFGAIDAGNSLSTEFGMFNETYINVPTSYGAGPVYFKASGDSNFKLGTTYLVEDGTHLEGRGDEYLYYSYTKGQDVPYFDIPGSYSYVTDAKFDGIEIVKDLHNIQSYAREEYDDDSIILSSYDDVNIDTDNHFNIDLKFDYNAILLYYSVYDQDDITKTAYATNLFGIVFLDGCRASTASLTDSFYIPTKEKLKSTTTNFGDSFSFRVNIKTMSVYDNTDAIIQDNTTNSAIDSVEFSEAISNMNKAIDILNSNTHTIAAIQDKYAAIMAYYDSNSAKLDDLSTCLNAYLHGTYSSIVNTSTLHANVIMPNTENASNDILISTIESYVNADNYELNDAYILVDSEKVTIPVINNSSILKSKNDFVVVDLTDNDVSVLREDGKFATKDASFAYDVIGKMFNSFNDVIINLIDVDTTALGNYSTTELNHLYVSPNSPLFNNTTEISASYLKDASGNIDYAGLVPYMMAQLQILTAKVNALTKN